MNEQGLQDIHSKWSDCEASPGTMTNQTITLHLSESEATISGTSLSGLAGEDSSWTSGSCVHLVHHHMLELLVVHRTKKDVRREGFPSGAAVQNVLTLLDTKKNY